MISTIEQLHGQIEDAWRSGRQLDVISRCGNLLDSRGYLDVFDFPGEMPASTKREILARMLDARKDSWAVEENGKISGVRIPAPVEGAEVQKDKYISGKHRFRERQRYPQGRPSRRGGR